MQTTILRLPAVKVRTGLSRSTIYLRISPGRFPKQVTLGDRAVGWLDNEIDKRLTDRVDQTRSDSLVFFVVVFVLLDVGSQLGIHLGEFHDPIDVRLLESPSSDESIEFLLVLEARADLRGIARRRNPAQRRREIVGELRS